MRRAASQQGCVYHSESSAHRSCLIQRSRGWQCRPQPPNSCARTPAPPARFQPVAAVSRQGNAPAVAECCEVVLQPRLLLRLEVPEALVLAGDGDLDLPRARGLVLVEPHAAQAVLVFHGQIIARARRRAFAARPGPATPRPADPPAGVRRRGERLWRGCPAIIIFRQRGIQSGATKGVGGQDGLRAGPSRSNARGATGGYVFKQPRTRSRGFPDSVYK
jgi:hypothetical protein